MYSAYSLLVAYTILLFTYESIVTYIDFKPKISAKLLYYTSSFSCESQVYVLGSIIIT